MDGSSPGRAQRALLASASVLALLACSSEHEGTVATVDDYATRAAKAVCAHLEPCCTKNALGFDRGNCELGGAGFFQAGVDNAKKRGMRFDADAADACLAGIDRATRACTGAETDAASSDACARVFVGSRLAGETCTDSTECAPSASGQGSCRGGFCVTLKSAAAVGDVCGVADGKPPAVLADCARSDLQCGFGSRKCEPLTAVGAPCPGFTQCAKGAYCAASGACEAKRLLGNACTDNKECASGGCVHGTCADNAVGLPTPCTGEK